MNPSDPRSRMQLARLRAAVARRPRNSIELKAALGLSEHRDVRKYADYLIAQGELHIAGWFDSGGPKVPIYKRGPGEPAPYPPRLTPNENRRNWRRRLAKDPDRIDLYDRTLAKARAYKLATRPRAPDPLAEWVPRR